MKEMFVSSCECEVLEWFTCSRRTEKFLPLMSFGKDQWRWPQSWYLQPVGKGLVSPDGVLGQWLWMWKINKVGPLLHTTHRNQHVIEILVFERQNYRTLENNICQYSVTLREDFLHEMKKYIPLCKFDQLKYIKTKNICLSGDTMKTVKWQARQLGENNST